MELNKAMDEIAKLNDAGGKGTVKLQGKTYTNVSTRVEVFRRHLGLDLGIETEVLFPVKGIMMIARVKDKEGFIIGSGHAYTDNLAKDKSLEKLESVAVGRAMASLGLSGGEYASDSEMESWQARYNPPAIHVDLGEDDVPPGDWLKEKIKILEAYPKKPRSTTKGLAVADGNARRDPIFKKLNEEQRLEFEGAVNLANKLLKEKEMA